MKKKNFLIIDKGLVLALEIGASYPVARIARQQLGKRAMTGMLLALFSSWCHAHIKPKGLSMLSNSPLALIKTYQN
ncbi:hypothetical protein E0I26_02775 [Flavobacterium rhamnosiphilum]|uniref:Uncharacterized protein n=1 Tax=Flavobacterium rhamnosiphilum TaxID=2541724 RepID=A0A4R5FCT3_9FLAO|nr:hypothetical protein [Flavobacterium rhamnosiphilum]TDE47029.1 hypothetical protein E0I26_02775 [Flavobacterium rhamnosiphilum]